MSHELPKLVPPLRCALVEEGVYRGASPSLLNHRYLARLRLRTVVSLLPEPPSSDLVAWCHQHSIHLRAERVATFKDEVTLTHERVAQLLLLAVQPEQRLVALPHERGVLRRQPLPVTRPAFRLRLGLQRESTGANGGSA